MLSKVIICLSCLILSFLLTSCQISSNFTRKDCQTDIGYNAYLEGFYIVNSALRIKPLHLNNLHDYCYIQGYIDAS